MSDQDFYEEDEPLEDIVDILRRPEDGRTGEPSAPRAGRTLFFDLATARVSETSNDTPSRLVRC